MANLKKEESIFKYAYMKKILLFVAIFAAIFSLIGFSSASAATPTLSLTNTGSTIFFYLRNTASYSSVEISYINPGSSLPTTISNTNWQTNSSGSFSTTIDANSYSIQSGASVYATVGGVQSSWVTFNNSGSNYNNFYLSQTTLSLTQGQNTQLTAYNSSGSVYLSSNSNSTVASSSVSGNYITVYANAQGSTTMTFCNNYQSSCATLYVTVSGNSGGSNQLTFSNQNPSLSANQNQSVNIYSPSTSSYSYYVSSNSNSSVVDTSISGSALYLYPKQNGTATITVCQYTSGYCGYLYATVGSSNTNGQVWFSPTNPSLSVGQSLAVSINSQTYYNTSASQGNYYYVSSNSNSYAVTATVSGATLNLYAQNAGTSNIQVCHSSLSLCGTLTVTVTGSSTGQNITFSNSSPSLKINETQNINIYSNYQPANYYQNNYYYINSNSNPTAVSASISGSQLVLTGMQNGYANIQVCQQSMSNCGSLTVTVSGNQYGGNTYQNGQLLNENGTIYIVYKNTKTPFANAESFKGFGFRFEQAWGGQMTGLNNSGRVVTTAQSSHPWGSWIVNNSTVYFVHEQGLIPIPTWDVFLNNGGQERLLVQANTWDMQRTQLTLMVYGDTRLR